MKEALNIDYEYVSEFFYYDESSPTFLRWKKAHCRSIKKDKVAGCIDAGQRYRVSLHRKLYACSRIVFLLHHKNLSQTQAIDHIDGNALNNRIDNLRLVNEEINLRNRAKHSSNKSGIAGVSFRSLNGKIYWYAMWSDLNGKDLQKNFSTKKYGEKAKQMAIDYRNMMIAKLNEQGAGYTERHGK